MHECRCWLRQGWWEGRAVKSVVHGVCHTGFGFFRGLEFSNCSLFSKMYFFFRLLLDASFHCDLYSSIVPPAPQRTTYSPDSLIKSRTTKGPHSIMYSFGKAIVAETFFSFAIHGSAVGQNVNCNFLFIIARPAYSALFYE